MYPTYEEIRGEMRARGLESLISDVYIYNAATSIGEPGLCAFVKRVIERIRRYPHLPKFAGPAERRGWSRSGRGQEVSKVLLRVRPPQHHRAKWRGQRTRILRRRRSQRRERRPSPAR